MYLKKSASKPVAPAKPMTTAARIEAANRAASARVRDRILTNYRLGAVKSWADTGLKLPAETMGMEFNYANLVRQLDMFVAASARQQDVDTGHKVVIENRAEVKLANGFALLPRQQKCVDYLSAAFADDCGAVLTPLEPGEGKSFIAAAEIIRWQRNGYFNHPVTRTPFPHVLFYTKAGVVIKTERTLRKLGVADVGTKVRVIAHTSIGRGINAPLFMDATIKTFNQVQKIKRYMPPPPALVIVDECQDFKYIKSSKSLYLEAIIMAARGKGTRFLFTSATPFVTVNDTYLFSVATGAEYNDMPIDRDNFPAFARTIAFPSLPSEPKAAATDRYMEKMAKYICRPPRDPRKVKAYNSIMLAQFPDERTQTFYRQAEQRYQESRERCGENPTDNPMAAFTIFRAAEEFCKARVFAQLIYDSWKAGKAPICGVSFMETVREITLILLDMGVPRDQIALVWGGTKEITEAEIFDAKTYASWLTRKMNGEEIPKKIRTKMRKTNEYFKQRYKHDLTKEEQLARNTRLRELSLHGQTLVQRQDEVDAFQEGRKNICIFTLAAGGTGIDLDHQVPTARPREGFFTICYYAEEFLQALGRGMRRATISDINQHMVFFDNSIAAEHVAPRLLKKIAAVGKVTASGEDLVTAFERALAKKEKAAPIKREELVKVVVDESDIDDSELDDDDDDDND